MGLLDRFRVRTPRPNLVEAVESIEGAVGRLSRATDKLEALVYLMRDEREREAESRGA